MRVEAAAQSGAATRVVRWLRTVAAAARHESNVIAAAPSLLFLPIVLPLVFTFLFLPAYERATIAGGGKAVLVSGMAVLFGFTLVGDVSSSIFREHWWKTWERVRVAGAPSSALVFGKCLPRAAAYTVQVMCVLFLSVPLVGVPFPSSVIAVTVVVAAYALTLSALGFTIAVYSKSDVMASQLAPLVQLILCGIGGAFAPVGTLPPALRAVSRLSPVYWALRAIRRSIAGQLSVAGAAQATLALIAICIVVVGIAAVRFDASARKRGWV
jgi:ABC-2 type transport system permease protein